MSDFKITPKDVGRVAVDCSGLEFEILHVEDTFAFATDHDMHAIFNTDGSLEWSNDDPSNLTHWKPRTLEAPKLWWILWRDPAGVLHHDYSTDFHCVNELHRQHGSPTLIARIYAEHWHGCEEGTFHTPETIDD